MGQQAKTGFFLLYGCFEFSCALVVIWGTMAIAEDFSTSTLWCPSYGSLLMRAHQQQQQQSKNDSRKTIKRKEYCVVAYYIFLYSEVSRWGDPGRHQWCGQEAARRTSFSHWLDLCLWTVGRIYELPDADHGVDGALRMCMLSAESILVFPELRRSCVKAF